MEYVSQCFADSVKMWSIEQMKIRKTYITDEQAFIELFNKYQFKSRNHEKFSSQLLSWRDIPWLHNIFSYMLDKNMFKDDQLDATVKVLYHRQDGIVFGYIESLTIAPNPVHYASSDDEEEDFCIDDFAETYNIEHDDFPRLTVFTEKSLISNQYIFHLDNNTYEFSFYKRSDNSSSPCYHYWEEAVKSHS